jgi:hypothetical protein
MVSMPVLICDDSGTDDAVGGGAVVVVLSQLPLSASKKMLH